MFEFLHQLFSSRPRAAGWHPVVLTPAQVARHRAWVQAQVYRNWLGPYYKAYHLHKAGAGGRRGYRVELLQEENSQGALFFYDASIGPGNFRHLFELLGERIQELGYHRACADQRTRPHGQHAETTLKQFFKPDPTDCPDSGRCNQRYGLLTLDLVSLNGLPLFLRLAANPVRESCFTPAWPFEQLLTALCDEPPADAAIKALIPEYQKPL